MDSKIKSSYVPPDIASLTNEWAKGETHGEKSHISEIDHMFAWMRGHQSAWYGWPNDGKGTFFDFMALMKAKFDGDKFCFFKQEDMTSTRSNGKIMITANDIYKNLVWTTTAQTPYKHFAAKYHQKQIELELYHETLEWIEKHFFVIFPQDRNYKSVKDEFKFMHEKFGIDHFLIDPFKSIRLPPGDRTDQILNDMFIETKQFVQETNTSLHWIAHPKSMSEVKESKKEDSAYKVVNQYMVAGGAAWDNNMDSQYSVYRPERHLNPADPKVHFYNLKQRQAEVVGVQRDVYKDIKFDFLKKRYFFNGVCPLDGSQKPEKKFGKPKEEDLFNPFATQVEPPPIETDPDELPF